MDNQVKKLVICAVTLVLVVGIVVTGIVVYTQRSCSVEIPKVIFGSS